MKHYFLITILITLLFASHAHAATVSVRAPVQAAIGATVPVSVVVDTDGVSVNSVAATVSFDTSRLRYSGYRDEGVIGLWVEQPSVVDGVIRFSGVIPGGIDRGYDPYRPSDRSFIVLTLQFVPTAQGEASITATDAQLLRNDGAGTSVPTDTRGVSLRIIEGTNTEVVTDTTPPLPFAITFVEAVRFGKTPRLAQFGTSDDGSGIARFESRINRGKFTVVTSPYSLPARLFAYTLTVRAIDGAGNTQDASILVPGTVSEVVPIIALVGIVGIVWYRYRIKMRRVSS